MYELNKKSFFFSVLDYKTVWVTLCKRDKNRVVHINKIGVQCDFTEV